MQGCGIDERGLPPVKKVEAIYIYIGQKARLLLEFGFSVELLKIILS